MKPSFLPWVAFALLLLLLAGSGYVASQSSSSSSSSTGTSFNSSSSTGNTFNSSSSSSSGGGGSGIPNISIPTASDVISVIENWYNGLSTGIQAAIWIGVVLVGLLILSPIFCLIYCLTKPFCAGYKKVAG